MKIKKHLWKRQGWGRVLCLELLPSLGLLASLVALGTGQLERGMADKQGVTCAFQSRRAELWADLPSATFLTSVHF